MTQRPDTDPFHKDLLALLPRLRRFALSLTRSLQEGDDLVQGALEKALQNRRQWTPGTRLDSWMYRIVQNHWIDTVRARKARGEPESMDAATASVGGDVAADAERRIVLERTRAAMDGLPEDQRAVLSLVALQGMSYAETADILGIPIGTVMSRLARARSALAKRVFGGEENAP